MKYCYIDTALCLLISNFTKINVLKKLIIISVTNDLIADKRVNKVAVSLVNHGFAVKVIGRKLKNSKDIAFPYPSKRFRLIFEKGPLFYAEYNFRLFVFLLTSKADIFLSNDLDTLPANYLASAIRRKKLVYDSHELFTEVPELQGRKFVQNIWLRIEKLILPRVKFSYTVCDSIADYYKSKYGIEMTVVRNIPECIIKHTISEIGKINLPADKKLVLYQGALNIGRGIEFAIEAFRFLENVILLTVGGGDIEKQLKEKVVKLGLTDKILFTGKLPFAELEYYTRKADLGLSIEENLGLNYYFALPNKLFDYIRAEIPVLVSRLPETERIVSHYDIGDFIENHDPEHIAQKIETCLNNTEQRKIWKINLKKASGELCWENEEKNFLKYFK
jgi:glycosyltransferase involved in cell wall biosynthesis